MTNNTNNTNAAAAIAAAWADVAAAENAADACTHCSGTGRNGPAGDEHGFCEACDGFRVAEVNARQAVCLARLARDMPGMDVRALEAEAAGLAMDRDRVQRLPMVAMRSPAVTAADLAGFLARSHVVSAELVRRSDAEILGAMMRTPMAKLSDADLAAVVIHCAAAADAPGQEPNARRARDARLLGYEMEQERRAYAEALAPAAADLAELMPDMPAVERRIVARLVSDALAAGYTVSVCDGEAWTVKRSTDRAAILGALATTEADTLRMRKGAAVLSVTLIYGNGTDVISDYSAAPAADHLTACANALAIALAHLENPRR